MNFMRMNPIDVIFFIVLFLTTGKHIFLHSKSIDQDDKSAIITGKKYCLWLCKSGWDSDFIQELFPASENYEHLSLVNFKAYHNNTVAFKPKIFVYNIENAHTDALQDEAQALIGRFKPLVLVHLSDEWLGDTGRKWRYRLGTVFYHQAPLVLRSYSKYPYRSRENILPNVMQLPLGFVSGMLDIMVNQSSNASLPDTSAKSQLVKIGVMKSTDVATWSFNKSSSERIYEWSFIGGLKGHRERGHALEVFSKWGPNFVHHSLGSTEMRAVYNESRFVLVGRGQVNLDCFRIYEALICGAIPIVVGPEREIKLSFEFEGDFPPFLYADSYETALTKAQNMNNATIDAQRMRITSWYLDRIHLLRRRIDYYTTLFD